MNKDLNLIVKMKFGSHLYGTNTSDSDLDYKGVFLPSKDDILLGKIKKSYSNCTKKGNVERNTSDDVDEEIYSLHYFLNMAISGQTIALDMLHANDDVIIINSPIWKELVSLREKFYTKNLDSFVKYARKQAAKYGIKGSRLNEANIFLQFLKSNDEELRLSSMWDKIPWGEHCYDLGQNKNNIYQMQICGKIFQETTKVGYIIPIIERFVEEYGKRARQAVNNEGIDWKAISHAMRAAIQTKQIFTEGTIIFPLKDADFLKSIKKGELDYTTQVVPVLEGLMDEVEELSRQSDLPLIVDQEFWNQWLIQILEYHLFIH